MLYREYDIIIIDEFKFQIKIVMREYIIRSLNNNVIFSKISE